LKQIPWGFLESKFRVSRTPQLRFFRFMGKKVGGGSAETGRLTSLQSLIREILRKMRKISESRNPKFEIRNKLEIRMRNI